MADPPKSRLNASLPTTVSATTDTHRRSSDTDELLQQVNKKFEDLIWLLTKHGNSEDGDEHQRQLLTVDQTLDKLFDKLDIHQFFGNPVDEALKNRHCEDKNLLIRKDILVGEKVLKREDFRQGDGRSEQSPKYPRTIGFHELIEPNAPEIAPRLYLTRKETERAFFQFVYALAYLHRPRCERTREILGYHPHTAIFFGNFLFGLFAKEGLRNLQRCIHGAVQGDSHSDESEFARIRTKAGELSRSSDESDRKFYTAVEKSIDDRENTDPYRYLKRNVGRWYLQQYCETIPIEYNDGSSRRRIQASSNKKAIGRQNKTIVKDFLLESLGCNRKTLQRIVEPARALKMVIRTLGTGVIPLLPPYIASYLHKENQTLLANALTVCCSELYVPNLALMTIDEKITQPLYLGKLEDVLRIKSACQNHDWNDKNDFATQVINAFGDL